MEQVAERKPHFGIRKLTIGAASVLLGTTLWIATSASVSHAEETSGNGDGNANENQNNGVSTPEVNENTKVVVKTTIDPEQAKNAVEDAKSSSNADAQNENAASVKSNIQNDESATDQVTDAQKAQNIGAAQSDISATENTKGSNVMQDVTPAGNTNVNVNKQAANNSAVKNNSASKSVKAAQTENAINKTAEDVTKANINDAVNQGKVNTDKNKLDLSKLDLTKGEQAAGEATDLNLKAQDKLAGLIKANGKESGNEVATSNINPNDKESVDTGKAGSSLISSASNGKNSGVELDTKKVGKIVVEATDTGNFTKNDSKDTIPVDPYVGISGHQAKDAAGKTVKMDVDDLKSDANSLTDQQIAALFGMQLFQEGGENDEGSDSAGTIEVNGEKFTPTFNYTDVYKNNSAYNNIPESQYAYAAAIDKSNNSTVIWTTDRSNPGKTIHFWINGVEKASITPGESYTASGEHKKSYNFTNDENSDEYHLNKVRTSKDGYTFIGYEATGVNGTSDPDNGVSGNINHSGSDFHWIYQDGHEINLNDTGSHSIATAMVSGKVTKIFIMLTLIQGKFYQQQQAMHFLDNIMIFRMIHRLQLHIRTRLIIL